MEDFRAAAAHEPDGTGRAAAWAGRSKITAEVEGQLRSWGRQQPDVTLMELQQRLQETVRLHGSIGRLWQVLRRMELRLKKSRSTPKNKTLRKPNSAAQRGGRR